MFTDVMAFEFKVAIFEVMVRMDALRHLPSHRELQIQVGKFKRMTERFEKKFPVELMMSLPENKFRKMRGQQKHQLARQGKVVDRLCMKLVEEAVADAIDDPKITKAVRKRAGQKYVEMMNKKVHEAHRAALQAQFEAISAALAGSLEGKKDDSA